MNKVQFLTDIHSLQKATILTQTEGILQDILMYHYQSPGKMLRPQFAYALAVALETSPSQILPWASACEMLHNATLIHDDFQDQDVVRRDQETVWMKYGGNQAINAGDALLSMSSNLAINRELDSSINLALLQELSQTATQLVDGQSLEFTLPTYLGSNNLEKIYRKCVSYKTSRLFMGLARGVGIIANLSDQELVFLSKAFSSLGIIFQFQDDILDIFGDKKRDIRGNDIKEGKVSRLLVSYLSLYPDDDFKILDMILKPRQETTDGDILFVTDVFKNSGSLNHAIEEIQKQVLTIKNLKLLKENSAIYELILRSIAKTLEPIESVQVKNQGSLEIQWTC